MFFYYSVTFSWTNAAAEASYDRVRSSDVWFYFAMKHCWSYLIVTRLSIK